ncbi:MAG TPA: Hsp33 family molecular chaperone HslO [Myxococcales bacterium]|jgi:molecular chaperone Hsp33|nr:Hsp33 family molecular chaperone HslO [Myxococcales bacterium]
MRDRLAIFAADAAGLRLAVCTAAGVAEDAARRHGLAEGSAGVLALGLTGALLLAAHEHARVGVQLECNGPARGLLVDADQAGVVRGLVRAVRLTARADELARFDPRPLLASPHDERAGKLSIVRAGAGGSHRAAFPFAGGDLGAALTLFLRGDRAAGGELALEVLARAGEPVAAAGGALVVPLLEDDAERARVLGKPLRQGGLRDALLQSPRDADAVAGELARIFDLGPLRFVSGVEPRFACRCSRDRVAAALRSLGGAELCDMADKDAGATLTCDFCGTGYRFSADELRALAQP